MKKGGLYRVYGKLFVLWMLAGVWLTGAEERRMVTGVTGEFEVVTEVRSQSDGVVRLHVSFPSPVKSLYPENNTVVGELYLPDGEGAPGVPVVLLHILNGNFEVESLIAQELARAGTPAFWFKLPYYGERRPAEFKTSRPITVESLFQMLDQGLADFHRACDLVTAWYPAETDQVNLVGISMGGILAYDFAVQEPRVQKICTVMAGGDLWGIIQHARETRQLREAFAKLDEAELKEARKSLQTRDPLQAAPLLHPRGASGDILMINAAEDEVIPREHAERLAEALGLGDRLVWVEHVGHYSIVARIDEVIGRIVTFLANPVSEDSLVKTETAREKGMEQLLGDFLYELGMMLDPLTSVSSGQHLQFRVLWHAEGKSEREGSLSWKRDSSGRFVLSIEEPRLGEVRIGQSAYPWIYLGRESMLIAGERGELEGGLMAKISQPVVLRIQLLANLLKFGARVPGILREQGTLSRDEIAGITHVRFAARRRPVSLDLRYSRENDRYESCVFAFPGHQVRLDIQTMEDRVVFAEDEFAAPSGIRPIQVRAEDMQHTLSLVLEIFNTRIGEGVKY